jgi:hypothetical protein
MEYIAIGIFKEEEHLISKIGINSNDYDLKFVREENENVDPEVQYSIISFAQQFNLLLYKITKLSTSEINHTSSDVSQNLINYFLENDKSILLDFLTIKKNILPKKYFLIFAFEWHENELCRYKKIKANDLKKYFSENNSWYLWLYNYAKDYETPNLDIPLILEIDNEF